MPIYLSDNIRKELDYFQRLHEHYTVKAGSGTVLVKDTNENILYMLLSASLAMDISEEGFFENIIITDKQISGRTELQLDAYAFIDTESTYEKHVHLFQYKLHQTANNAASPVEVLNFTTLMNNTFVHPELRTGEELKNEVLKEIDELVQTFIRRNRRNKVRVKCHFINNAKGISKANEKDFDILNRFDFDKQTYGFNIQVYGEKEIIELATEGKIKVEKETIKLFVDGEYFYRYENNSSKEGLGLPGKVLIGVCNVNELVRLQSKYHHNQLYSENIRLYLGDRAVVNKDIIQTITSEESQWFPYMNNGISIICDNLEMGSINQKEKSLPVNLDNMQIINGCQTVNALYSAKYNEETKDKFRPANVLVKIYLIDPTQERFKRSIIRATNNQNAVKTSSLFSNDPIQIKIQEVLKKLSYLYDRKGEARVANTDKIVSMINAALAYRAVFEFGAQKLRARIGQSRVFQKEEYERIYKSDYVDDNNIKDLYRLSMQLLISSVILDTIRDNINSQSDKFINNLPIIKKSAYYLSGYYYAIYYLQINTLIDALANLLVESNPQKLKNTPQIAQLKEQILNNFESVVLHFTDFYASVNLDKTDIDNLLKSADFGKLYDKEIEKIKTQHK